MIEQEKNSTTQNTSPNQHQAEESNSFEVLGYPYGVEVEELFDDKDTATFFPKGDGIGTLYKNILIEVTELENGYTVSLLHKYQGTSTYFHYTGLYTAQLDDVDTTQLSVMSYGGILQRNVKVNIQITLLKKISSEGKEFSDWQGTKLYVFYASDGTISLIALDVDTGKGGQYMEFPKT